MKRTHEEVMIELEVAAKQRERDRAAIKEQRAVKAAAERATLEKIRADREAATKQQLRSRYINFTDEQYDAQWPQIWAKTVGDQVKAEVDKTQVAAKAF